MRVRSFRFLWIGQGFANTGDVLYIVALIAVLYQSTGSALYLSLLPFTITIARFLSGMCAPLVLNRFSLKGLLVGSQSIKTGLLGMLGLSLWLFDPSILIILVLVFIIAFLDGWAAPARNAMLPQLVTEDELAKANSFVAVVDQSIQFGGWALGGILVAATSGSFVIWVTFVMYVISTLMMGLIVVRDYRKRKTKIQMMSGWRLIWKHPVLRIFHVMIFIEAIANVVWIAAILYIFVEEVLMKSEAWWGYLNASFFIGLIAGGMAVSKYTNWFERYMKETLLATCFAISILTFVFGLISVPVIALLLTVLSGMVEQIKSIAMVTFIQKKCSKDSLPEVFSAQSALISITFGLGSLLYGFLAETISVPFVFVLSGVLLLASAFYLMKSMHFLTE
ncbi:MFS transporter [Guptibacillus hwajinpoensis]|uniref:MFS transporter n=1 Tax=Guptibacillus hwajinpoensis TaxID=208199 RepID=UPI001CFDB9E4|nr:MFS transporter [Pseudalkalibacillus hwajinpoensis]WLR58696.1 MFS transporter [Pseudalkalibacillus hwajinpoensis]